MNNEKIDFTLSINNMKDIPFEKYDQDFKFIVGGEEYLVPRIFADLLSPKVRRLHFIDESINEFNITIDDMKDMKTNSHFSDFLKLANYSVEELDQQRVEEYSVYFIKLGNFHEYRRLHPLKDKHRVDEVLEEVESHKEIYQEVGSNCDDKIKFISSHFYEIDEERKEHIDRDILYDIISSPSLVLEDEDSLLYLIVGLYERDRSYFPFFSKIEIDELSQRGLEKFIEVFEYEFIDRDIWASICRRLLNEGKSFEHNDRRYMKTETETKTNIQPNVMQQTKFESKRRREFNGILNYLIEQTGGNIHDNGTIEITSNSIRDNDIRCHPRNLVDYKNNNFYNSKDEPGVFICFDFKDMRVQLSSYSIKSHSNGPNNGHLRNWVVEVSNDGTHYEEIDRHSNDSTLNKSNITSTFQIKPEQTDFYQFVRLRQTGHSWLGYPNFHRFCLYFYSIEFFGILEEPKKNT